MKPYTVQVINVADVANELFSTKKHRNEFSDYLSENIWTFGDTEMSLVKLDDFIVVLADWVDTDELPFPMEYKTIDKVIGRFEGMGIYINLETN